MNRVALKAQLRKDEDSRLKPYLDPYLVKRLGLTSEIVQELCATITVGVGHNLGEKGITPELENLWLESDIDTVTHDLDAYCPWWRTLDDVRQQVLANMCFNMGIGKLLTFVHFLTAMQQHDWVTAAKEMMNSLWAKEVGARAWRLTHMIQTGTLPAE